MALKQLQTLISLTVTIPNSTLNHKAQAEAFTTRSASICQTLAMQECQLIKMAEFLFVILINHDSHLQYLQYLCYDDVLNTYLMHFRFN